MQQHNTNGLYRTRVTVWLANRQRAKCSSGTIVPGERKKERCAGSAKRDRTGDGKRRRTNNARRDGKPDGQTGASGEWRATKRENGAGGAETSGWWRATKRENGTGGAETSGGWRATKRENGAGGAETSGWWRATKRENGTGGAETSGGWRATKRENGTGGAETSGGWRATKRENGTGGAETTSEEAGRSMLTDHSNNSTKQASRNSRINLSHTLERRRRATARYTSTNHYGALTTASKH